ncbi:MAG: energy-coupling factor transporter ATPase [Defluviitaleaceae bacterium]|nr:energy-coupling factor transporter ATPase [Defluviitaleaceae bacterium]
MPIEIKDLTFIYSQGTAFEKKAVDNINLTVADGEFLGLIGHTGSGKSTLIQHMNALLKPTSGHILLNGVDIHSDKSLLKSVRQRVGLVFQYPEHQLFEMTVRDDVAFGPKNMGLTKDEVSARAEAALQTVGLAREDWDKSPFELSGGQKRRAAIAGVLAMRPEVLILDEPTAGLDPRGRDEILGQIREMHDELGISVVLVSHSMEDVARLATRAVVMYEGKIAFSGTPAEVFGRTDELEAIGLAAPRITYLMKTLKSRGWDAPDGTFTVEGAGDFILKTLKNAGQEAR